MKNLLVTLCLTNLLLGTALATKPVPAIELKQKSSFDATEVRDPFWPIGWKKSALKGASSEAPDLSPASFP